MIIHGIPSGDLECWCFLVDKETFESVSGRKPKQWDVGRFWKKGSPYKYMLYPLHLIEEGLDGKVVTLSVEAVLKT